jgi:hypothetical protein
MFTLFVRYNNKDFRFSAIFFGLVVFVLIVSLRFMYTHDMESFGANSENKSLVASPNISQKYPQPILKSSVEGSQNKSLSNTTHVLMSTPKHGPGLNMSSNNAAPTPAINQSPWTPALEFVVSGLAAGAALFIANIALDRFRRPQLLVDKNDFLKLVEIDINLYDIDLPNFSRELQYFKAKYVVNRVIIKNKGKSAAEGCKGILKMNNMEEKICWYVPSEKYKMTINVDSIEYLDVCAVLNGDANEVYAHLRNVLSYLVIQKMEEHKQGRPS